MPTYTFVCDKCHRAGEKILPMQEADEPQFCSVCDSEMRRDFQADLPFTAGRDYHRAIVSDSLAISIDQVAEHRKHFPDIELACDGVSARPVFDNYKRHDDYLKKTGFKKSPQKIRRRGKRIA